MTALEDSQGTRVQILLDRKAPMIQTLIWCQFAIVMPIWMLIEDPGVLVLAALPIGVLAAARAHLEIFNTFPPGTDRCVGARGA